MIKLRLEVSVNTIFPSQAGEYKFSSLTNSEKLLFSRQKNNELELILLDHHPFDYTTITTQINTQRFTNLSISEGTEMITYYDLEDNCTIFQYYSKNFDTLSLENVYKVYPIYSEPNIQFYAYIQDQELFRIAVRIKPKGIEFIKQKCLLKGVKWIHFRPQENLFYIGTADSSLILMNTTNLEIELQTKLGFQHFDKGPIDAFCINQNHLLLYKINDFTYFVFVKDNKTITIPTSFDYKYYICYPIGNLIFFIVPNKIIAIIDTTCNQEFIHSSDQNLVNSISNEKIMNFHSKPRSVFSPDTLEFSLIDVQWDLLSHFLEIDNVNIWKFVAHILTYVYIIDNAKVIFQKAISLNRPFYFF